MHFSNMIAAIAIAAASVSASAQTTESLHKVDVARQHCLTLKGKTAVVSYAKGAMLELTCYKGSIQPKALAADERTWKGKLVAGTTVYTEETGSTIIPPSLGGGEGGAE